ncbi:MAG: hypothetical protein K1X79_04690 [Oligoflexia bacterium]|nr:hypothetical protein [Oligoflexia bacterium]
MANNQSPTLQPVKDAEPDVRLDHISIQRTEPAQLINAKQEEEASELGSTSFAFNVERKSERELQPAGRRDSDLRTEPEQKRASTQATAATRTSKVAGRGGFKLKGQSLLDRYINLAAKILKFLERTLLGLFRRNKGTPVTTKTVAPKQPGAEDYFTPAGQANRKRKLPESKGPHL